MIIPCGGVYQLRNAPLKQGILRKTHQFFSSHTPLFSIDLVASGIAPATVSYTRLPAGDAADTDPVGAEVVGLAAVTSSAAAEVPLETRAATVVS